MEGKLKKKLQRIVSWNDRVQRILERSLEDVETEYRIILEGIEQKKEADLQDFQAQEENLTSQFEKAGQDFVKNKYILEKETAGSRADIKRIEEEISKTKNQFEAELSRLKENQVKTKVSYERQKTALNDLYQEKRTHLIETKRKLTEKLNTAEDNFRRHKNKFKEEMGLRKGQYDEKLKQIRDQIQAKKEGWDLALSAMNKELEGLTGEKTELEKKLSAIRSTTEKDLISIRSNMALGKEQLEIDKATLIERAEDDKLKCEKEINDLRDKVEVAENNLQAFLVDKEKKAKNDEEMFEREESALKDAVRAESEKRDYEQRLLEQERVQKNKELNVLKEEYDKKKWYWDNQLRNLMMQKSVQDAEFDAEKMRVNREARVVLRSLEAKRDELKQRLADIKSRHSHLVTHEDKEKELRNQRFKWRKDRLWTMWQNRLAVLKKERMALGEQLEVLEQVFISERSTLKEEEGRDKTKIDDVQTSLIQLTDGHAGLRKQKEIQSELEKTRVLAQIKECETHISDWQDRLKATQEDISKQALHSGVQVQFIERMYKEEESETEIFLHMLRKIISSLELSVRNATVTRDAA